MLLGQIAIENIELDARCRDDVPAVLKGIQYIYCKEELRQEIFTLLENHILEKLDPAGDSPEAGRINRAVGRRLQAPTLAVAREGSGTRPQSKLPLIAVRCCLSSAVKDRFSGDFPPVRELQTRQTKHPCQKREFCHRH